VPRLLRKMTTKPTPAIETATREDVITRLRSQLMKFTDSENSVCKVAAEQGIFCNGFRRYTDDQLRDRYWWIVRKNPDITRAELETVANDWQLAQQEVFERPMACDVQQRVKDTCRGWNDFTNEQIGRFYFQMTGKEVRIV
jgi:hypothetical protein